jgi:hypothetical protein
VPFAYSSVYKSALFIRIRKLTRFSWYSFHIYYPRAIAKANTSPRAAFVLAASKAALA